MNSTKEVEEITENMQYFSKMLLIIFITAVVLTTITVLIAIKTGLESFAVIAIAIELFAIFLICASLITFTIRNIRKIVNSH